MCTKSDITSFKIADIIILYYAKWQQLMTTPCTLPRQIGSQFFLDATLAQTEANVLLKFILKCYSVNPDMSL